jgi:ArsR family transcriptional regulator
VELPREALKIIADRFKLLSNPSRLEILQHICTEEMSVGALVTATGLKQANVSKQLGLLDRAGLVRRRMDGNHVYYVVADDTLPRICEIMQEGLRARQMEFLSSLGETD